MATAKKISHEFTGNPSKRDSYEPRPGFKQRGVDHGKAPKKYTRRYGKALKKSRGIKGRLLRNQGREYRKGAHVNKMFIEPGTGKAPWANQFRDPRHLIGMSIREIVAVNMGGQPVASTRRVFS